MRFPTVYPFVSISLKNHWISKKNNIDGGTETTNKRWLILKNKKRKTEKKKPLRETDSKNVENSCAKERQFVEWRKISLDVKYLFRLHDY